MSHLRSILRTAGVLAATSLIAAPLAGCSGATQTLPGAAAPASSGPTVSFGRGTVHAPAVNLLQNGSFETGDLTGWSYHNPPTHYPCAVYNDPTVAMTEPTGGLSPDPVGNDILDCVANPSNESITQNVELTEGTYAIGFSAYPFSYQNPDDEKFTALVGGTPVASINSANVAGNQWYLVTGTIQINSTNNYLVRFKYKVAGHIGRDMYIDRAYLIKVN